MSQSCPRPECGGEQHTDPWGAPVLCPHTQHATDTGRRCPRCDCPDGHEQCDHCKTCSHVEPGGQQTVPAGATQSWIIPEPTAPAITILSQDNRTPLVTIHPTGELEYGPGYSPDEAARAFWDALRRLAPARCPNCGHIGLETP